MQQYTGIYQNGGNIIFNTTPVTVFSGSGGSTASGMGSTVIVTTVAAGSYAQADYSRTPYNATNVYTDWDIRYRVSYTFSLNLTNANTTVRIYAGGLASTALATSLTLTGKKCLGIELKGPVTSGTYASKVFTCDGTTAQLIPPTAPTTASTDNAFYTVVFDSMANGSTNIYWGMLGGVPTLIHTLTGCPTGLAADAINCGTGIQIVNTAASAASSITVHGGQMQTYY